MCVWYGVNRFTFPIELDIGNKVSRRDTAKGVWSAWLSMKFVGVRRDCHYFTM
jgi:hypothetical protein